MNGDEFIIASNLVLIAFSCNSCVLALFLMQLQVFVSSAWYSMEVLELMPLLELIPVIKHVDLWTDMFQLTAITSVFPVPTLSSSTLSNNCCKSSLFSAINTVSSVYLKLFLLCPPILIPGHPSTSMVSHNHFTFEREKV